ncbi:hypothetical protein B0J15DRAFT_39125 [Fusarium solani]|uniref:Uncharacterized protein n=1 Tax=Fusarium solani TaxID=169388 RepID=A0A9P9H998_FUSSL|nr:uncharacterized protein B0J15DRAFT_39125 [Fusarium solani]KAH7253306.1 hypothetical protein B0J15DRAFT_39125 [Fusarium solani]
MPWNDVSSPLTWIHIDFWVQKGVLVLQFLLFIPLISTTFAQLSFIFSIFQKISTPSPNLHHEAELPPRCGSCHRRSRHGCRLHDRDSHRYYHAHLDQDWHCWHRYWHHLHLQGPCPYPPGRRHWRRRCCWRCRHARPLRDWLYHHPLFAILYHLHFIVLLAWNRWVTYRDERYLTTIWLT